MIVCLFGGKKVCPNRTNYANRGQGALRKTVCYDGSGGAPPRHANPLRMADGCSNPATPNHYYPDGPSNCGAVCRCGPTVGPQSCLLWRQEGSAAVRGVEVHHSIAAVRLRSRS